MSLFINKITFLKNNGSSEVELLFTKRYRRCREMSTSI